jgi:transglutaminase-like putative cysteine protease
MAEDLIRMQYTFADDAVHIRSEQGGKVHTSEGPAVTDEHVGRSGARKLLLDSMANGVKSFSYNTVKPELGADLVAVTSEFKGTDTIDVGGRGPTETSMWDTTIKGMSLKVTEWMDQKGTVLQMHIDSGTGRIEAVLSTQLTAEAEAEAETKSPELVDSTNVHLVEPAPLLHSWSGVQKASYKVYSKTGTIEETLPSTGYQRVSESEDGTLVVSIDLHEGSVATAEDLANKEFLESSAMVDATDPAVRDIAIAAVGRLYSSPDGPRSTAEIVKRAHALRVATKNHIKVFDLATGYASASETARRASGDCSEHAVLLAALLRADGIASRVCSGLVYTERTVPVNDEESSCAEGSKDCKTKKAANRYTSRVRGSFAWHAWTQGLIAGKWVDLDATLHAVPYSVGHVLMGTASLSDRTGHADEMRLVSLVGNLGIDVLSVD